MSTQEVEVGFTPPFFDIVRVGNVGTQINVDLQKVDPNTKALLPVNLSNGIARIDLRKPNGKVFEIDAIKTNPPGVDGKMFIIDIVGLFTVRGRWAVRGVLDMSNGNIFKGSWCGFPVDE